MLRYLLPLVAAGAGAVAPSPPPRKFFVLSAGSPPGKAGPTTHPPGPTDLGYFFNTPRPRPPIPGAYPLSPRGFPTAIDLTGHDYYKAPVDEHFTIADGEARWKSTSEQGQAAGQAFYITVNGAPSELAWLVQALEKAPNRTVKLLPGGEAHLE